MLLEISIEYINIVRVFYIIYIQNNVLTNNYIPFKYNKYIPYI